MSHFLLNLKGPYGRPPYPSSGISQNIQPSFGRKRRSTRSGTTQANERYAWYGNSLNKAGICPLYGRRKRFAEADKNEFQPRYLLILKKCTNINVCIFTETLRDYHTYIIFFRFYSSSTYHYGGASSYSCARDSDCVGNLKCCSSYGVAKCTYPHYFGGYGGVHVGYGR